MPKCCFREENLHDFKRIIKEVKCNNSSGGVWFLQRQQQEPAYAVPSLQDQRLGLVPHQ